MVGLRELAILGALVLALYGRTGLIRSRRFQAIWPWIAPVRRKPGGTAVTAEPTPVAKSGPWIFEGNRLFWFLTILAATAVATSIVTRALILRGEGPAPYP